MLVVTLAVLLALTAVWVTRLVRVSASVADNAAYWSVPRGEPGGLLYVALGDSAAQGVGASEPARGYVGLLAGRLRAATGEPVQVLNLSRSGARIADVLDRQLPALRRLGRVPDLLTVAIGGNDVRGYDRDEFAVAAGRLMAALPAGTYVADVPYFMHGRWERDAAHAARLLREQASGHGLRSVGLHAALAEQGSQAMLTQFAADGFHPNDAGHRVWADAFWEQIAADPLRDEDGPARLP